jgi:hypothetical protein
VLEAGVAGGDVSYMEEQGALQDALEALARAEAEVPW